MSKFSIFLCLTVTLCGRLTAMDQDPQVLAEQLLEAAKNGNKKTIEALLRQDVPVDTKDNHGDTPLMLAAERGRKYACELLLTHKAQANAKNYAGFTPLMCATLNGRNDVCKLLLTHKAHVDTKNHDFTPLMWAAMNGPKDVCKLLLTHNAHAGAKNNFGNTPLMFAAWNGHEDVCKLLLTQNAHVDARNSSGATPLIWAAWNDNADVCKWLIDVMIQKHHKFTKNKRAIITFLGMKKKNGCLRLIGHDMVLCIAQMVFNMAQQDNVNAVAQINAIKNNALKTELLNYYQTQLSILQSAQPKDCLE
jgi:ankyrin repeat protein